MSKSFEERLTPLLPGIVAQFGSPFHLYDEQGMLDAIGTLKKTCSWLRVTVISTR